MLFDVVPVRCDREIKIHCSLKGLRQNAAGPLFIRRENEHHELTEHKYSTKTRTPEVTTVFGYPGGSVLDIYDELYKNAHRIDTSFPRMNRGAAHAADACRVTAKRASSSRQAAPRDKPRHRHANAYLDSVPLVAVTGTSQCASGQGQLSGSGCRRHHAADRQAPLYRAQRQGTGIRPHRSFCHRLERAQRARTGRHIKKRPARPV